MALKESSLLVSRCGSGCPLPTRLQPSMLDPGPCSPTRTSLWYRAWPSLSSTKICLSQNLETQFSTSDFKTSRFAT